jgi:hypothetical protein
LIISAKLLVVSLSSITCFASAVPPSLYTTRTFVPQSVSFNLGMLFNAV